MRKYLKSLRESKNISQQVVADKIGITRQYYSSIENGERQADMSLSIMKKLSEVFNISLEHIVEQELRCQNHG